MRVALIVAVAANGIIGRDNALPWRIPADLKWFKATTLGKPVIMGRKTWDSIGRPLPGRANIVVTRQDGWSAEGAHPAHSLDQALAEATRLMPQAEEAMIIGGATLYAESLPRAQRLYWTDIHRAYDGDAAFPAFDRSQWQEIERQDLPGDPDISFVVLNRR